MLGACERAGGTWKAIAKPIIQAQKLKGKDQMTILATEVNSVVNDCRRVDGFSPSQWVLGKQPFRPGDQHDSEGWADIGVIQDNIDPTSAFYLKAQVRAQAKKEFVRLDTSKRVKRALAHKAAPIPLDYQVGDLISFKRKQGAESEEEKWSTASRVIGFDGRHLGHTEEKCMWVLCESLPVCVAVDKVRPCTPDEILAWQYLNNRRMATNYQPGPAHLPQSYVNEEPTKKDKKRAKTSESHDSAQQKKKSAYKEEPIQAEEAILANLCDGESSSEASSQFLAEQVTDDIDPGQLELITRNYLETLDQEEEESYSAAPRAQPSSSSRTTPYAGDLRQQWHKTQTTGRGTDLLDRLIQRDAPEAELQEKS